MLNGRQGKSIAKSKEAAKKDWEKIDCEGYREI